MKRWRRRILIAAALVAVAGVVLFEISTHIGRGWLFNEPFYDGRPASYWADEIERWETQDPTWQFLQRYTRRPPSPRWLERFLPEPAWPKLLDGDPDGLPVLQALRKHPSSDIQDWARIGIERIDNDERGPYKFNHPSVILTAQLYEVDEAFHNELVKAKWLSLAELEKMERILMDGGAKPRTGESLLELPGKQKLLVSVKDIKIDMNKEGMLLSSTTERHCLPSPAQMRKGQKGPQKIEEGMALRARVEISADRRCVRVRFTEKSWEVEGIDKIRVLLDNNGTEGIAEVASVKEATLSLDRSIPDGGTFLLPLQYRPAAAKEKGRWLAARVEARIYIEAEERMMRGEPDK
jgi:hypothetical protein